MKTSISESDRGSASVRGSGSNRTSAAGLITIRWRRVAALAVGGVHGKLGRGIFHSYFAAGRKSVTTCRTRG